MATVETNTELGRQIVEDAKRYVLYSWSVQDAINPIAGRAAPRAATSGTTTASATSTSPRSSSTSRSATSTRRSSRRSRSRPRSSRRSARRWRPSRARRLGRLLAEVTPGDLDDVVLHERRRRGERERDQARALVHGPAQDHRALPLLPRRDRRRDHAHRRPAPLARRARAARASCGCSTRTRTAAPPAIPTRARSAPGAPHLEEILQYEGADTVAAVILETVTGTNGIIVPPDGYLQSIREVCDRHGILLIADEVMAGFGRTGKWFARRQLGRRARHPHASPRGSTPATCRSARWSCASRSPTGCATSTSPAGSPTRGHPLACASAVASIEAFQEEGIVENAAAMGERVRATELRGLAGEAPVDRRRARARLLLGARAGAGTARRASRSCRSTRPARRRSRWRASTKAALDRGLYLMTHWNVVMVCPPLTITREELDEGIAILDDALAVADEHTV